MAAFWESHTLFVIIGIIAVVVFLILVYALMKAASDSDNDYY